VTRELARELQVLRATGSVLGDGEVVYLETPARHAAGVLVVHCDQTALPAARQRCCRLVDSLGVVPELLVECGAFTHCAIDQIGARGMAARIDIRFHRHQQT